MIIEFLLAFLLLLVGLGLQMLREAIDLKKLQLRKEKKL